MEQKRLSNGAICINNMDKNKLSLDEVIQKIDLDTLIYNVNGTLRMFIDNTGEPCDWYEVSMLLIFILDNLDVLKNSKYNKVIEFVRQNASEAFEKKLSSLNVYDEIKSFITDKDKKVEEIAHEILFYN